MNTPPADLRDADLVQMLGDGWALRVASLRYVPKGFGTHHWLAVAHNRSRYFVNVDDLDGKPWLGAGRQGAFHGLQAAFATAAALRDEARLPFVVAPIPSRGGRAAERLTDRYAIALFPFVAGQGGGYADTLSPDDRGEMLRMLGALHGASVSVQPPRRDVGIAGRDDLERALAELDRPWGGGPFAEPARAELGRHAGAVQGGLTAFDQLSRRVAPCERVITHGEPHAGNVLHVADGLRLVDWDTVALARPERDLWMLDDGSESGLLAYTEVTGRTADPAALALYRLAWPLTDIAMFTATLRSPHERNADTELAWRSLHGTLGQLASMQQHR